MPIQTLFAQNPTVINATFDKVWVEEIVISAPNLSGDATARVKLRKFRTTDNGAEFAPEAGHWIEVEEIMKKGEADADLALAIESLMTYVAKEAIQQGIVAE